MAEQGSGDPDKADVGRVAVIASAVAIAAGYLWWSLPYLAPDEIAAAQLIWLHGLFAQGLLWLAVTILRTRNGWVLVLGTTGLIGGVLVWLYSGFIVFVFFGCRETPACVS